MDALKEHVLALLAGEEAHASPRAAVTGIPSRLRGARPDGFPHTAWQLLEHLRRAQHDILRYCVDPRHKSPEFPEEYWPASAAPPNAGVWDRSVKSFLADLAAFRRFVMRTKDLLAPLPHAKDATALGVAFVLANHNSYHLGQLVLVRKALGAWQG